MKAELIARPTEYRGIQYRSKCEAMFALWLDLRYSEERQIVIYEPEWGEIEDYTLDFAVHRPQVGYTAEDIIRFVTSIEVIEYKPVRPTFSYINRVFPLLKKLCAKVQSPSKGIMFVNPYIYWGSVFSEDRGFVHCRGDGETSLTQCDWIRINEKRIRDYRFDLESEVNNGR